MTNSTMSTVIVGLLTATAGIASAGDDLSSTSTTDATSTTYSAYLGPVDFLSGGFGVGGAISPASHPHWRFGSTAYRLALPKFVTELNDENKGWDLTLTFGIDINASYQVNASGKGLFFELIVPYERYRYQFEGMSTESTHVSVVAGVGYKWLPFDRGLFIRPQMGLGVTVASTEAGMINGKKFADPPVKPLPILHVGYEF